ncbi:MAG: glycerate kinase [Microbacteriaceae bacterium]
MKHILIASDSFKGTASSQAVATHLAQGWKQIHPGDELSMIAMADGGEGTIDAFAFRHPGSRRMPVTVLGPDGRRISSEWLLLPDGDAVVELANSSGITHLNELDVFGAHSYGFGEALAAAINHGAKKIYAAIGGSASTDGGAGMLMALGAELLDESGKSIPFGNIGLAELSRVELSGLMELPRGGIVVLSDVRNPLLGPEGAAQIFGEQKGAQAEDFAILESNLKHFASFFASDAATPGSGAAGGCGYGLLSIGATLSGGSDAIADALGLAESISEVELVITGEGRFDNQSGYGKVADQVRNLATAAGVDCALVAGQITAETDGFVQAVSLSDLAGSSEAAMTDTLHFLVQAGRALAQGSA